MIKNLQSKRQKIFKKTIQQGIKPLEIPVINWSKTKISGPSISHALFDTGLAGTISAGKRVTEQGGTAINDKIITDPNAPYTPNEGDILRVGKRRIVKIRLK